METYHVAWWNVENLFDEENSPRRTEKLARTLGTSIVGWTPELRDRKIAQLASVIQEQAFYDLDGPVRRLCAMHVPIPFSPSLEDVTVPSERQAFDLARTMCNR